MATEDRQLRLEELFAHQQHLIDVLNAEVTRQQREIDRLHSETSKLDAKVKLLSEFVERLGEDLPHEKPPHY